MKTNKMKRIKTKPQKNTKSLLNGWKEEKKNIPEDMAKPGECSGFCFFILGKFTDGYNNTKIQWQVVSK